MTWLAVWDYNFIVQVGVVILNVPLERSWNFLPSDIYNFKKQQSI